MSQNKSSQNVRSTLSKSKHYFVTKAGHVIPLLSILAISGVEPKPNTKQPSELKFVNKEREKWALLPANSLIVCVPAAFTERGPFFPGSGQIVVPVDEVPAFLSQLEALG